ncbi:hypothetical protein [Flavobacterium sp. LHD-85]|uniref:hypothetical protein n=1 Tax=Flavobacterium sp. LHD-85 TaxID=3071410 RepID=UPI0027E09189|nr:hypothetical protein [Flavobacterium sp. LHD-85]MDQ6532125.1 hypothetical protein [Flavobacterium sp. LHD-85]
MNHAKNNYIGNSKTARTEKRKTALSAVRQVCRMDAETQRPERGSERQTNASSFGDASDGFLKTSFLPRLLESKTAQALKRTAKLQRDFYKSLSHLAVHYKIEMMQTSQFEYPYSIALALWDLEEKLKTHVLNCPEIHLVQDREKTFFVSEEKYNTGTTLYYIPIEPLYQMLHNRRHRKNAQLLLCVCSYLYRIADIPYHRQENSYLYWMYEMHKDSMEQDDEQEENQKDILEFEKAELIGDRMEQKISSGMNLEVFEKRLNSFKVRDEFDRDCEVTARKAFDLLAEYPTESIFRNAPLKEDSQGSADEYETIGMEKYISFTASTKGWLYESIAESINSEFNEYGGMDEPTIYKSFESREEENGSLDFESRLFDLLDDMCSLLYHYKNEEI